MLISLQKLNTTYNTVYSYAPITFLHIHAHSSQSQLGLPDDQTAQIATCWGSPAPRGMANIPLVSFTNYLPSFFFPYRAALPCRGSGSQASRLLTVCKSTSRRSNAGVHRLVQNGPDPSVLRPSSRGLRRTYAHSKCALSGLLPAGASKTRGPFCGSTSATAYIGRDRSDTSGFGEPAHSLLLVRKKVL